MNDTENTQGYTPRTNLVSDWLDQEFPEGDVIVQHTEECDRESAGDQCQGGCPVIVPEEEVTYIRIDAKKAESGDEVFQAGEWHRIENAYPMKFSDSVKIVFEGGGSHAAPSHHFTVRRAER